MPDKARPNEPPTPPEEPQREPGVERGGAGEKGSEAGPTLGAAVGWYIASLGAIGGLVGLFAGLSSSPVIGTLLPLLFTLIGGTGGVYLIRMRLESSEARKVLRYLGKAVLVFSVACLAGALVGIPIRTGRLGEAGGAVAGWLGSEQARLLRAPELLALGVLDSKLRVAGIAPTVHEQILLRSAEAARASDSVPEEDVRQLREAIQRVTLALQAARERGAPQAEGATTQRGFIPFRTRELLFLLPELDEHLAFLEAGDGRGDPAISAHYASTLSRLDRLVGDFLQRDRQAREELEWLEKHAFDYSTVLELQWVIRSAMGRVPPVILRDEEAAHDALDDLVEMTLEGSGGAIRRDDAPFAFEQPPN